MNAGSPKEPLPDFVQGALLALERAAQRARERALATNTPLVQWRDGKVRLVTVQGSVATAAK